jgi:hypothetical protein
LDFISVQLDFFGVADIGAKPALQCFVKADHVVRQLQALSSSFYGIILQEGIKSFQVMLTVIIFGRF